MIVFYKTPVVKREKPILKRTFKKSRRIPRVKKLTNNNKAFLQALGFKV